ncbi:MAG: hypothetical protein QM648_09145 [Solirubrobacterales bacterium]
MTTDPDKHSEAPQRAPQRRFNPFLNEEDMFKVVLWVAGAVFVLVVLAVVVRALL